MRRPMWKIHCMTVVFLTGINFYLLVKLLHCAEKSNDHNRTSLAESSSSGIFGWYPGQHGHSRSQLDVQVKGIWKTLQLAERRTKMQQQHPSAGAKNHFRSSSGNDNEKSWLNEPDVTLDSSTLDLQLGRWDDSRRFVIRDFAVTGHQFHSTAVSHNVCLATQSSLDRLHWLGESADHWRGAISFAIYLDDEEVSIFNKVLAHMRRCHPDLLANIAFHVISSPGQSTALPAAFPATFAASSGSSGKSWTETDDGGDNSSFTSTANCTGPSEALTWLLKERPSLSAKWESGRPYPQNLMRNVARKGCPSHYVLLLDVDVIPSYNMAESLVEFLDRPSVAAHCAKCAFVVSTYELDYSADFPQNKSQLLALENQGRAQPFHHKAFRYNQFASNLTRWRQTSETDQVVISHNVTNYEFFYEPFYIGRDDAPPHDERFLGYGFTRNTQVYEMALSGWSFHVLSPIFTIHWGMQMKQRRPAWRKNQMDRNRRLFDVIHHELKAKYGLLNKSPVRWHPKPAVSSGSGRLNSDVKQQHPLLVAAKSAARTSI